MIQLGVELRWHPSSEEHIAGHGVTWDEVEQANTPPTLTRPGNDPGTVKMLGRTFAGRYLALILAPDEGGRTTYLITARDMNERERRIYRGRVSKG